MRGEAEVISERLTASLSTQPKERADLAA